ncbi:MAG: nucleoside recognition domain-containing protein [Coprobacillus sp.]
MSVKSETINDVKKPKKGVIEVFSGGVKRGLYIGLEQVLPAMILGYVIVSFLQLTGITDVLSVAFGPVMGVFGLPGEAVVVLISAFFAKAAGASTAAGLYANGVINAAQATILIMPCMLMGTLVGHFARIVLVANVNPKHRVLALIIPLVLSIIAMLVTRLILMVMGLM